MALVVGLYDGLIGAISDLLSALRQAATALVKRESLKPAWRSFAAIDWPLLIPVGIGMVCFLLLALFTIAPLMESHPTQMRGLFMGMIAVSIAIPIRMMPERFNLANAVGFGLAAVVAFVVTGLPAATISDPSLWYVLFAAAIAINALILPGVSGSYIMILMGVYGPVTEALRERDFAFVGTYLAGALLGLGTVAKALNWLLHHKRQMTLAVLAGLMVGTIRSLWPWQSESGSLQAPHDTVVVPVLLFLCGAGVIVAGLVWEARRKAD